MEIDGIICAIRETWGHNRVGAHWDSSRIPASSICVGAPQEGD